MSYNGVFTPFSHKLDLLLDGVGDEQAGVLLLIQQHHGSQVSHSLLAVARAGDHANALHLGGNTRTMLFNCDYYSSHATKDPAGKSRCSE